MSRNTQHVGQPDRSNLQQTDPREEKRRTKRQTESPNSTEAISQSVLDPCVCNCNNRPPIYRDTENAGE